MKISEKGLEFLKRNEGLRLRAYKDSGGRLSIGCGHLIMPDDDFGLEITEKKAMELLTEDATYAEDDVNESVKVTLEQHEFDALTDFAYNVGGRNFRRSTLLKLVNSGHYGGVPAQFERWVYAGDQNNDGVIDKSDAISGLLARRRREAKLFTTGDYGF